MPRDGMEIEIRLHGGLRQFRPRGVPGSGQFCLEVDEGSTLSDVIGRLRIPVSWIRVAYVNQSPIPKELILHSGDRIDLFPPAGGGSTEP